MKAENDGGKMMQGQVFGFGPSRVPKCGQHKDHSWLLAGTHGVHMINAFQNQFLVVDCIAQKKI
jgi:hypothetical protein